MLHLHVSNRYAILREILLAHMAVAPEDPFVPREIIVPGAAIQGDLERALADRLGVAAGVEFSFLALWIWRRMARLVPTVAEDSPFAPERAQWRIARLLEEDTTVRKAPGLRDYLAKDVTKDATDDGALLRHAFAKRIAALFATYITYRPDYLAAWERRATALPPGRVFPHEAWQAALWRHFRAELESETQIGEEHPAETFFQRLERGGEAARRAAGLDRLEQGGLHLFCLFTLPPLHLEFLLRLADWTDIHLYLLNPSREYWLDMTTLRRAARLRAEDSLRGTRQSAYLHDAHPLLADWGRQTQALFSLLLECPDEMLVGTEHFREAADDTLLHRLQNSFLRAEKPEKGAWPLAENDRSVEIHVAHSLPRQLEILRDQLLLRFDAGWQAHEILVALPDLDEAASLIDAVFAETTPSIPYVITGLGGARENPFIRLLLLLMDLALPPAELPASQVLALLQEPLAAASLGLSDTDLAILPEALREAGLCWGLDAEQETGDGRQETKDNVPPERRHTWRDALARLFLGYALPATEANIPRVFAGILPAGGLAGSRAEALGAVWLLLQRLEHLAGQLREPRPAAGWRDLWQRQLTLWTEGQALSPENEAALRQALSAIAALTTNMAFADPEGKARIPARVARIALENDLEAKAAGARPSGVLTFAPLAGLRGLPYRMICLLGLEDGVFPRREQALEFDLMPLFPRPGDRQRRDEDRNLFLDCLLASEEALYLSYTGKNQRDDSEQPPSILVAQLRDFLQEATGCAPSRLVVTHPLQAFSPEYFHPGRADPRLCSFRADYADILNSSSAQPSSTMLFFPARTAASAPDGVPENLTLADLQAFFRHPARALLRGRLGIALQGREEEIADIEPQEADALARHRLAQRLLPAALAGEGKEALLILARSGVEFPGGRWGEVLLEKEVEDVLAYAETLLPCLPEKLPGLDAEPNSNTREFSFQSPGIVLDGVLGGLTADGLLRHRYAIPKAKDYIAAWIDHLCLNASLPGSGPESVPGNGSTRCVARGETFFFAPLENAPELLADWLAAWRAGQHAPLPFYPETAWAWINESESKGRAIWQNQESQDPWWTLALRGRETPLDEQFAYWRDKLLRPLRAGVRRQVSGDRYQESGSG